VAIVLAAPKKDKLAAFKSDLEGSFTRFFEKLPRRPSLEQAERVSDFLGVVDYPSISRELIRPGLALIGDAGLVSDPVWGVGCGFAFQTAEWLVDATAEAVVGKADLGSALKRYQRRHHAMLAGHHFLMCDYSSGRPLNALERLMFSSAARNETMAHHLSKFGTRQSRVRDFLAPSALARAVWVNTGRRGSAALA
jgi:flavin-dependent dehydrogenase